MVGETSVADDQLAAFVDRILRMKSEEDAIKADVKEIYAEAKANGYDKTRLGDVVSHLRKIEKDASGEAEKEAIRDLYLTAYYRSKGQVGTVRATHTHASERGTATQVARHPEAKASKDSGATEQDMELPADSVTGDASRASVGAGSDAPIQPETAAQTVDAQVSPGSSPVESEAVEISTTIQPETADQITAAQADDESAGTTAQGQVAGKSVEASASAAPAPIYAAPGIVTEEHTPPEPVKRHPISAAFAELGQDSETLRNDVAKAFGGVSEPIVKIGAEILDGWARYNAARSLIIDYPVVQYGSNDPLADAVRWNIASRKLSQGNISTVISRLAKLYPDREQEILGMFHSEYAEAAE